MHLAIRILRWLVGLLLISTLTLNEDSEKKVQSRLETWWLRLAYGQEAALSTVTAFLRVLARLTGSVFDRLFGRKLFSLRGLGVSVCYSIASFFLCIQLVVGLSPKSPGPTSLEIWFLFLLFLLLGSTPAVLRRSDEETLWVWGLSVTTLVLLPLLKFMDFLRQRHEAISPRGFAIFLAIIFVISTGSDFCYIAVTRWMLRRASELKHWVGILGIVLLDCVLGLALFLGPLVLGGLVSLKASGGFPIPSAGQGFVVPKGYQPSSVTLIATGIMLGDQLSTRSTFLHVRFSSC